MNIYSYKNNFFFEIILIMPKKSKKNIESSPTEHDSEEHRGHAKKKEDYDELDDIEIDDELSIQKKNEDIYSET